MVRCVLAVLLAAGLAFGQDKEPLKAKVPDLPAEKADATAEVKLARKILEAELKRLDLIETRIVAGSFHGGSAYVQLTDGLQHMTDAADELFPEAKDRLPWYEFRLALAKRALDFNTPRIKQGVEEPQLGPQLEGACYKAELALLKLNKQIKK